MNKHELVVATAEATGMSQACAEKALKGVIDKGDQNYK